jgi:hypothetical protein
MVEFHSRSRRRPTVTTRCWKVPGVLRSWLPMVVVARHVLRAPPCEHSHVSGVWTHVDNACTHVDAACTHVDNACTHVDAACTAVGTHASRRQTCAAVRANLAARAAIGATGLSPRAAPR